MNKAKKKKVSETTEQIVGNFASDFASIFKSLQENWVLIQQNTAVALTNADIIIIERRLSIETKGTPYNVQESVNIPIHPFSIRPKKPSSVQIPLHAYIDAIQERSEELGKVASFFGISHNVTTKQNKNGEISQYTDRFRVPMSVVRTRMPEISDSKSVERQYSRK